MYRMYTCIHVYIYIFRYEYIYIHTVYIYMWLYMYVDTMKWHPTTPVQHHPLVSFKSRFRTGKPTNRHLTLGWNLQTPFLSWPESSISLDPNSTQRTENVRGFDPTKFKSTLHALSRAWETTRNNMKQLPSECFKMSWSPSSVDIIPTYWNILTMGPSKFLDILYF